MKTVKIFITAVAVAFSTIISAQTVDLKNSKLKWTGEKVTGTHWGYIGLKSGSLKVDGNTLKSGMFVIDMPSITCVDIEDAEYNKKLVGHLESDDFFSVDKYSESTLKITKAATFKGGKATVTGDLTIKGVTHPVTFTVEKSGTTYTALISVDRTKYDIKYGSGSFFDDLGDKMIYDEFKLEVTLATK